MIALAVILAVLSGSLDESCVSCDEAAGAFSEAASVLAAWGYPADLFTVLLSWDEASRRGPVTGYRVRDVASGESFDLYGDEDGQLLGAEELASAGVRPKRWQLTGAEAFPEVVWRDGKAHAACVPRVARVTRPDTVVTLPPLDLAAVRAEDEWREEEGVKATRTGVFLDLDPVIALTGETASVGRWRTLRDGSRAWSAAIRSAGAVGQRLRFTVLRVPDGARVIIYNSAEPREVYGPFERSWPGETDFWSPTCFGEEVVIECVAPPGAPVEDLHVVVDRIAHIYRDLGSLRWEKAAGSCNPDVSCYPDWTSAASGVAGIGAVDHDGTLWCTAALLADTALATDIPYLLTANHCVSRQDGYRGASTVEVYWLYQTGACAEEAPDPRLTPRTTGGADFLVGSGAETGTDFTLLRLRREPPEGVTYLGWRSDPIPVGEEVVCIHHPSGDHKRISFGTVTDHGSLSHGGARVRPFGTYHEVCWSLATTEPGSSGSPLMLADTQQVIGQLWGGYASCVMMDEPDYFGRFDITFPLVETFLDPLQWLFGDVNGDGVVDALDAQLVVRVALGLVQKDPAAGEDLNGDGRVNAVDIQLVVHAVLASRAF